MMSDSAVSEAYEFITDVFQDFVLVFQNLKFTKGKRRMLLYLIIKAEGDLFQELRDYDRALKCLKEAERRKDDHPHTFHLLAICLGHMGRVDEAKEAAKRCEELHPGFLNKRKDWNIYIDPMANKHLAEGLKKVEFGN